jgi:hypothetical protein
MKVNAMSLYRSAADRREQSQQREQGPPPHQTGSRLGPYSGHCTYRSATGYIWVTAWLPASGMRPNLSNMSIECRWLYLRHGLNAVLYMNTVLVEKVLALSRRLFFSNVSLGTISDAKLIVRPYCLLRTSLSGHCLRCEIHVPAIPVSDLNLTTASLCASGRRAGYQLRQRIAAERRQRGSSQQQGANGSGQASVGICGRQQCHLSSELSQVALWIRQQR